MKNDSSDQKSPSLVINIQSWTIPIVALVALIAGFLGGYLSYPLIQKNTTNTVVPSAPEVAQATTQPTVDPQKAKELMDLVVSKTRHLRGNPDAPVVLIEFSDFQ